MPKILPLKILYPKIASPFSLSQIYAVISTIVGHPVSGKQATKEALASVLSIWRARVGLLTKNGWEETTGNREDHLSYVLNCMPVCCDIGLKEGGKSFNLRHCNLANICPWCWSRRVGNSWQQIERVLFPQLADTYLYPEDDGWSMFRQRLAQPCTKYDLVVRSETYSHAVYEHVLHDPQFYSIRRAGLKMSFTQFIDTRIDRWRARKMMRQFEASGAIEVMSLSGDKQGTHPTMRFRQLLLYPAGAQIPEAVYGDPSRSGLGRIQVRRIEQPTPMDAVKALASVQRYPTYLLRSRDLNQVVDLYNAMCRRRNVAAFGEFLR